jgi:EAL domain-containing protein (putative c-di-GMP-specific phosphodiesterase class I)/GGDEF domain-containing protein
MREKIISRTIISLILLIVVEPILLLLGYKIEALVFAILVLIYLAFVIITNNMRIRYMLIKKKKAIICANIDNSELVKLYYGTFVYKNIIKRIYKIIKRNFATTCVSKKFGEQFIILYKYDQKNEIVSIINKINKEIQHALDDDFFTISLSFGIQICDNKDYETNENKAVIACNGAKKQELNLYSFYNIQDTENELREKQILLKLIKALKNNEFEVYFQPKYDFSLKKIVGSEALVRLVQNGEIVKADEFIDIAEKYGFTVFLDRYVFKETCKKICELKKANIEFNTISINVSRSTLCEEEAINYYVDTLEKCGLNKKDIELEVTERSEDSFHKVGEKIHKLSKVFNVSLDDFGVGNSSLSMLMENSIKTIKIDRHFVIDDSPEGRKILNNIIKLIKELGFNIVAEGVETEEQKKYLESKGCHVIQGYYYSKPLTFEEFKKLLENGGIQNGS